MHKLRKLPESVGGLLFFLFLMLSFKTSGAGIGALDYRNRNHIIIAVDNVVPLYEGVLRNKVLMLKNIHKILNPSKEDAVLRRGDFLSVVTFGLGAGNSNLDNYVRPSVLNGRPMVWRKFTSWEDMFPSWQNQVLNHNGGKIIGAPYSMLSGVKPFTLQAVKSDDASQAADRTFLLLVTDDHYNANDNFRKEFAAYKMMGGLAPTAEFEKKVDTYNTIFKDKELRRQPVSTAHTDPYQLILFEIIPTNLPALNGVVSIPASLNIHRVPGGVGIKFKAQSVDDFYELRDLAVTVHTKNGDDVTGRADADGEVDFVIPHDKVDPDRVEVSLDGSVLQKDGMYDGMLASTYNINTPHMHTQRTVSIEQNGKIFGAEMPDFMWWWYRDDVKMAAFVWEVIFILIIIFLTIAAIGYYNKVTTRYNLSNDEIGIRAVRSGHSQSKISLKK